MSMHNTNNAIIYIIIKNNYNFYILDIVYRLFYNYINITIILFLLILL